MKYLKKIFTVLCITLIFFSCKNDTTVVSNEMFLSGIVREGNLGDPASEVNIHFKFLKFIHYNQILAKKIQPSYSLMNSEIALYQNYPNPFSSGTQISYSFPAPIRIRLEIFTWPGYDFVKTLVNDDTIGIGHHSILWNGTNDDSLYVTNGIYSYRLTTSDTVINKLMVLYMTNPENIKNKNCIPVASTDLKGKFSINHKNLPPVGFSIPIMDAYGNETGTAVVSDTFNIILLKDGSDNLVQSFAMNANKNIFLNLKTNKQ